MAAPVPLIECAAPAHDRTGIAISLGTTVERISLNGNQATGVDLDDGRHLPADIVVSNMDPMHVYRKNAAHANVAVQSWRGCVRRQRACRWGLYVLYFGGPQNLAGMSRHHTRLVRRTLSGALGRHLPPQAPGGGFFPLRPSSHGDRPFFCHRKDVTASTLPLPGAPTCPAGAGLGHRGAAPCATGSPRAGCNHAAGAGRDDHRRIRHDSRRFSRTISLSSTGAGFSLSPAFLPNRLFSLPQTGARA